MKSIAGVPLLVIIAAMPAIGQGTNFYPLSKLYRGYYSVPSGRNYITFPSASASSGSTSQGPQYYILERNNTTFPGSIINEYWRDFTGWGNHMTNPEPPPAGYIHSITLGRIFNSGPNLSIGGVNISPNPLKPISRFRKEWTINGNYYIDHAISSPLNSLSGYTNEGVLGYGFERYGFDTDGIPPINYQVTKNYVTIGAMSSWGGGIGKILYNNLEYVNRRDAGRLLQLAANRERFNERYNPTEGGDIRNNGSPMLSSNVGSETIETTTMPLMWLDPNTSAAPPLDNPLIFGGTFRKVIRMRGVGGSGSRIIQLDARFTPHETTTWGSLQIPALYLNPNIMNIGASPAGWHSYYRRVGGSYQQIWTKVRNITTTDWLEVQTEPAGTNMLLIAHGNGNNRGIGILVKSAPVPTTALSAEWGSAGASKSHTSFDTHAIYIGMENITLSAGQSFNATVWILIGTKDQIISDATTFPY